MAIAPRARASGDADDGTRAVVVRGFGGAMTTDEVDRGRRAGAAGRRGRETQRRGESVGEVRDEVRPRDAPSSRRARGECARGWIDTGRLFTRVTVASVS